MPVTNRYLIDGHWLEAAGIEGRDSTLPTIVMLHEGLGSVLHWKDFPRLLAEATGAGMFLYSRYGHGTSDPLQEPRSVRYMHHEAHFVLQEILQKQFGPPSGTGRAHGGSGCDGGAGPAAEMRYFSGIAT